MNNPSTLDWVFVASPAIILVALFLFLAGYEIYEEYFGSY